MAAIVGNPIVNIRIAIGKKIENINALISASLLGKFTTVEKAPIAPHHIQYPRCHKVEKTEPNLVLLEFPSISPPTSLQSGTASSRTVSKLHGGMPATFLDC